MPNLKKPADKVVMTDEMKESLAKLTKVPWWLTCKKRLLLIRPRVPGDNYTNLGSYVWAEDVKTKALAEGWEVKDLGINDATREKIEDALTNWNPALVIHYDHGSSYTMWGQEANALEPGIDTGNVAMASGHVVSTVSCLTAGGLGPDAITKGIVAYIGYTDLHTFWTNFPTEFGAAANAANFALLECKTVQEAFDLSWAAYDDLYNDLMASGHALEASAALHDRDCLALLGTTTAVACPSCACHSLPIFHCVSGLPDSAHCKTGLPDSGVCKFGNPLHCVKGLPDVLCKYGSPYVVCKLGLPGFSPECKALPDAVLCKTGGPVSTICGKGPDGCLAGPPLRIKDIYIDYPDDIFVIDRQKIPQSMQKAFDAMIRKIAEADRKNR
jgi:hypothetical protein